MQSKHLFARGLSSLCILTLLFILFSFTKTSYWHHLKTWHWNPTKAKVLRSEIQQTKNNYRQYPYRVLLEYEYQIEGQHYTSQSVYSGYLGHLYYDEAKKLRERFTVGETIDIYVHPELPIEATTQTSHVPFLIIQSLIIILTLMLMAALVELWIGAAYPTLSFLPWVRRTTLNVEFWSLLPAVYFAMLTIFLILFLTLKTVLPQFNLWKARNWSSTQCMIELSEVRTHPMRKGSFLNVLYSYDRNGIRHYSNRFDFSRSGMPFEDNSRIQQQYLAGSKKECKLSPNKTDSVLIADIRSPFTHYFSFLILAGISLFGVLICLKSRVSISAILSQFPQRLSTSSMALIMLLVSVIPTTNLIYVLYQNIFIRLGTVSLPHMLLLILLFLPILSGWLLLLNVILLILYDKAKSKSAIIEQYFFSK